jgi:hypothetical protein
VKTATSAPTSVPSLASTSGAAAATQTSTQQQSSSNELPSGAIVGIAAGVGAFALLALIAALVFFLRRHKRKGRETSTFDETDKKPYESPPRDSPTPSSQYFNHPQYAELGGGVPVQSEGPNKKPKYVDAAELHAESHSTIAQLWGEQDRSPVELDAGQTQHIDVGNHGSPQNP